MSGVLDGAHPQKQRREIFDLHNKAVSFGGRAGLENTANLALGGIFRRYLEADMHMLDGNAEGEHFALAEVRHDLLLLRRDLIEEANQECRETLSRMLEEHGSEAVHYHLNIWECSKVISDAGEFVNKAGKDDPAKLYRAISNSGGMENKVSDNLKKLREARPLIKAGAKPAADSGKTEHEPAWKRALKHPMIVAATSALILALLTALLGGVL